MRVAQTLVPCGILREADDMTHIPAITSLEGTPQEQARLEGAHYELCTALTVLRSNVELVRIELHGKARPSPPPIVESHLFELDAAVDRLQKLAGEIRVWHARVTGDRETQTVFRASANSHALR